jgi:hypothetical protein
VTAPAIEHKNSQVNNLQASLSRSTNNGREEFHTVYLFIQTGIEYVELSREQQKRQTTQPPQQPPTTNHTPTLACRTTRNSPLPAPTTNNHQQPTTNNQPPAANEGA